MSRKLTKDISIEELEQMRESGMSNADIANALDVSYATIRRYLGTQPTRRRPSGDGWFIPSENIHVPKNNVRKEEPADKDYEARLIVTNQLIELTSLEREYTIDCSAKKLVYKNLEIPFDVLPELIKDLETIQRHLKEVTVRNEMW